MPDVLLAYAVAALLVAIVFVVAFFIGKAATGSRFVGWVGLILVAIALLEKTGWTTRPWTAGSPAAAFNDLLFRILFLVGCGLLFVSWTIALRDR
ncbi:MAG: hypothetical protein ACLPWF_27905 [Bryobacteraceae bacterium]